MEEKCLESKWCEVIEQSGNGFIGKIYFSDAKLREKKRKIKSECFESEDKLWDFMHMEVEQHY